MPTLRKLNTMRIMPAKKILAPAMVALLACAMAPLVFAQSTPPSTQPGKLTLDQLRQKANEAFEDNDFATALPLLKDLSVRLRNNPAEVAPLLEKIRVCEANLAQQAAPIEGINAPRIPHPKPQAG